MKQSLHKSFSIAWLVVSQEKQTNKNKKNRLRNKIKQDPTAALYF